MTRNTPSRSGCFDPINPSDITAQKLRLLCSEPSAKKCYACTQVTPKIGRLMFVPQQHSFRLRKRRTTRKTRHPIHQIKTPKRPTTNKPLRNRSVRKPPTPQH